MTKISVGVRQAASVAGSLIALSGSNAEGASLAVEMAPAVVREVYGERLEAAGPDMAAVYLELFQETLTALSIAMNLLAVQTGSSAADVVDALTIIVEGNG